jgi:hypothetical protein
MENKNNIEVSYPGLVELINDLGKKVKKNDDVALSNDKEGKFFIDFTVEDSYQLETKDIQTVVNLQNDNEIMPNLIRELNKIAEKQPDLSLGYKLKINNIFRMF